MSTRVVRSAVATTLVLLACACTTIPTSGEVQQASDENVRDQEQLFVPQGPAPDATRQQIVSGFIDAMRAEPVSTDVASEFLAPGAVDSWQPGRSTVVYDYFAAREVGGSVTLSLRRAAELDARGVYTPAAVRALAPEYAFELRLVEGQWRITNPPDATYVPLNFFQRVYEPVSLYFFDVSEQVLVPEPVYLPQGDQLATGLVRGVLAGPGTRLSPYLHTVAPSETELEVSVPVRDDGVAEVRLSGGLGVQAPSQAELLAAQIVATLRQVSAIKAVRITVGDVSLDLPGASEILDMSMTEQFEPSAQSFQGQLYALKGGRLFAINESGVSAFTGLWGEQPQGIGSFDVDLQLSRLAALSEDGTRVLVDDLVAPASNEPAEWLTSANDLVGPVWDRAGQLWAADRSGFSSQVYVMNRDRQRRVDIGRLADQRIEEFAISPDGVRIAVLTRSGPGEPAQILLGLVVRHGNGTTVRGIGDLKPLPGGFAFATVLDVGWRDGTTVALLAREEGSSPQPYLVRIDGSSTEGGLASGQPPLGSVGAVDIATSGNATDLLVVGDRRGRLWYRGSDEIWSRIPDTGLYFPTYPG